MLKYIKNVEIIVLELVQVGNDSGKRMAYDSGLVRSDLSKDNYHKLLCKQSIMLGHGKLLCCQHKIVITLAIPCGMKLLVYYQFKFHGVVFKKM